MTNLQSLDPVAVRLADEPVTVTPVEPAPEPEPAPVEPEKAPKVQMKLVFEINGWEQLRIAELFHRTLQQFEDDLVMACRIALFVDGIRKGVAEGEAFQGAMKITAAEVLERVDITDAVDEGGVPLDKKTPTT